MQLEARHPRLAAAQAERHEAVERRPDLAGPPDVRAPSRAAEPGLREPRRRRHVRDEHDLLHRHVDALRPTPLHSAVSAANAASGPVCAYAVGSVQRTGARSGSPVQYMFPVAAITPRSEARHAARGPSTSERRDPHPHRVRRARRIERRCAPRRARRVDHDVGARRAARRARDRRPRGRAPACRRSTRPATLPVERVARRRNDPHDRRRRGRRGSARAARPGHRRDRRRARPSSRLCGIRRSPPVN